MGLTAELQLTKLRPNPAAEHHRQFKTQAPTARAHQQFLHPVLHSPILAPDVKRRR